ncbi:hypothetical protein D3C81_1329300 [compost metagenome]
MALACACRSALRMASRPIRNTSSAASACSGGGVPSMVKRSGLVPWPAYSACTSASAEARSRPANGASRSALTRSRPSARLRSASSIADSSWVRTGSGVCADWLMACRRRMSPWLPCNRVSCRSRAMRSRSPLRSCRRARNNAASCRLRTRTASASAAITTQTHNSLNQAVCRNVGAMWKLRLAGVLLQMPSSLAASTSKR